MINIPTHFENKLNEKPGLLAAVRLNFEEFEPWLEQSGMPFFPGFTDHSPRHINEVLKTASSLISDSSWSLLSAEDVAVLCLAILLHDCGMHLTQDSFRSLVSTSDAPIVGDFGDRPWDQIWREYLREASRFGQEKLIGIFGNADPIVVEDLDLQNLSERDFLLVGEFVRRHHTRLAHEIAICGVGRTGAAPLKLTGFDKEICDLAGLVARSHGMSIRSTFSYVEERYGLVSSFRGVKIPFVMAVLRIADYIQVQSERAIASLLRVKELRSPISRLEWNAHFAVRDVSTNHADPEALYVHAMPEDAKTFLKLTALFKDIQRELDDSWATLGEVYGRHSSCSQLGITIRRIRSNIDDVAKFASRVNYIPIKAKFETSGPDLLTLLVGPLYGYDYSVGIRELMQNAIDACREAYDVLPKSNGYAGIVQITFDEDENGGGWVTVKDNGVGMSLDVLTKYYLVAGASFRNSEAWKKRHLNDEGNSRVMRGGRFGVGALAAFLLGEEITVRTRHIDAVESEGIEFTAKINDSQIELRRCKLPHGTEIKVFISDRDILDALRPVVTDADLAKGAVVEIDAWHEVDWYRQNEPELSILWNGYDAPMDGSYYSERRRRFNGVYVPVDKLRVPQGRGNDHEGWNRIENPFPYKEVYWRFIGRQAEQGDGLDRYVPDEIVVNGIIIQTSSGESRSVFLKRERSDERCWPTYQISRPSISILDPGGQCPINLQRNSVAFDRMGFDIEIAKAILRTFFAEIRDRRQECRTLSQFDEISRAFLRQKGINFTGQAGIVALSLDGVFLASGKNILDRKISKVFFLDANLEKIDLRPETLLRPGECIILRHKADPGIQDALSWFRGVFSTNPDYQYSHARSIGFPDTPVEEQVALMPDLRWQFVNEKKRISKQILSVLQSTRLENGWCIVRTAPIMEGRFELERRISELMASIGDVQEICGWTVSSYIELTDEESVISQVWREVFGSDAMAISQ